MKRKTLALILISVIIAGVGLYVLDIYAFTTDGIPTGTCPEFSFVSGREPLSLEGLSASMPFKILSVGSGLSPEGSGISWCTYGSNNLLVRSYHTNSILNILVTSSNGEYVAASDRAGTIYLFDSSGRMLWDVFATSFPLFTPLINSNGSVIVGYGANLFYINHQGKVLWNYSSAQSATALLVNEGSYVAAGVNEPNSTTSSLVLFDSTGKAVWNDSIYHQYVGSADGLAVSNGHIALAVSPYKGGQSFLKYYDLQGNLIWSRAINSSALGDVNYHVNFQNNGSQIYVGTVLSHVIYDLNGNEIGS